MEMCGGKSNKREGMVRAVLLSEPVNLVFPSWNHVWEVWKITDSSVWFYSEEVVRYVTVFSSSNIALQSNHLQFIRYRNFHAS